MLVSSIDQAKVYFDRIAYAAAAAALAACAAERRDELDQRLPRTRSERLVKVSGLRPALWRVSVAWRSRR